MIRVMNTDERMRLEYRAAMTVVTYAFRARDAFRLAKIFGGGQWGQEALCVGEKYQKIADDSMTMLENVSPRLRVHGTVQEAWSLQ